MKRQKYIDIAFDAIDPLQYDFFQIKYDGIWARIEIQDGQANIYSRSEKYKTTITTPNCPDCILLGEYMFGSQRAQNPELKDLIFIFDCLAYKDKVFLHKPYSYRYAIAKHLLNNLTERFRIVTNYDKSSLGEAWETLESTEEGFVLRKADQLYHEPLFRCKYEIEEVFYAVDFHAGMGKHSGHLGAISVAKSPRGAIVMRVGGGFSDDERRHIWEHIDCYRRRPMRVVGKGQFASGALRHPNFVEWVNT